MSNNIVKDLRSEILKIVEETFNESARTVDIELEKYSRLLLDKIKENSMYLTGDYKKGWTITTDVYGVKVIHNEKEYRLTHLLENGYIHVSGRFIPGRPHIAASFDETIEQFEKDLIKKLGG